MPKNSGFHGNKPTSGFEVLTGSGKVPYAIALVERYIPLKFHSNRSIRIGGGNIFNVLLSINGSWGAVKSFVPSY